MELRLTDLNPREDLSSNLAVLLIPAYKPEGRLVDVLVRAHQLGPGLLVPHILVINDGSGAEYEAVFDRVRALGYVTVVEHATNLGKGAALKTGFNYACVKWPKAVGCVTADADGQHSPEDIVRVAAALVNSPHKLILGVRGFDGRVPFRSRAGNSLTRRCFQLFTGRSVADTQTGLRGWPRKHCLESLSIALNGYDFELECLVVTSQSEFQEVPIRTIYLDNNSSSHFNPLRDSMRIYYVFLRYCGSAAFAAFVDSFVFYFVHTYSGSIGWGHVVGRALAVAAAFVLARNVVFQSDVKAGVTFLKYLALVVVMGFISYTMLQTLHDRLGVPVLPAKLLAEGLLFLGNFAIQRDFIFLKRGSKK